MTSLTHRFGIAAIAFLFVLVSSVSAQDYRGKVQGTVSDEAGAALPGASVVLRNTQTGAEVTRQSDTDGHYIFDFVEPGQYIVVVEQSGFKKAVQENVIVRNRADITVDLKLSVGGVQETVTVESPPIAVQFASSSTQLTIENALVDQLPVRGRNPYNVVNLDPTVSPGTGRPQTKTGPITTRTPAIRCRRRHHQSQRCSARRRTAHLQLQEFLHTGDGCRPRGDFSEECHRL